MEDIEDEFQSSKSFDDSSNDEEQGNSPDRARFSKNKKFNGSPVKYNSSSTTASKESEFKTLKSKNTVFVNSTIFGLDNR